MLALVSMLFIAAPVQAGEQVNINSATITELQSVKGIGPKTAAAIVAYRDAHGAFADVDDLENVKGIGEKSLKKIEDNLMLNETANSSIEGVMNDYKGRKKGLYDLFYKLKEESNKVAEQQKKNYEAIQAVKEEYKKAYEKIIGKFHDDRNKILKGFDFDKVKPKLNIK